MTRIALIHATPLAVEPVRAAFARLWPQARPCSLLDDSLPADLTAAGTLDERFTRRFRDLVNYAVATDAQAVLFTCSAFGATIGEVRRGFALPILKPEEAMFRQALHEAARRRRRIGLVTTFALAAPAMRQGLLEEAAALGIAAHIEEACVPQALQELNAGDERLHDKLVVEAAASLSGCDVLVLGQFSMARAAPAVQATLPSTPVLTSPDSAVQEIRGLLRQ